MREYRLCDEFSCGLGWMLEELVGRTSHALAAGGGYWLVDPLDVPGLDERLAALGEPRGVIQLLDRHARDCALLAGRLGVPHHRLPSGGVPGAPFELVSVVRVPLWRELALWWPAERVLVAADALGTLPYFLESGARLGVHPLLRLTPPRALGRLKPLHVLTGHGEGLHGEPAARELGRALSRSRRGLPAALLNGWRFARNRD